MHPTSAADEFSKLCDGFSIGSNDLTQLVMGADRDSDILQNMGYFDERNLPVLRAIEQLIETAHCNGCTVSICGQAPSVYPRGLRHPASSRPCATKPCLQFDTPYR